MASHRLVAGLPHPNSLKTHCAKLHAFTTENTGYRRNGWRFCKACKHADDQRQRAKPGNAEKAIERGRAWRTANPERSRDNAASTYDRIRQVIEAAKDAPCMDCDQRYPHYVMDFDHRDPSTKILNVGLSRSLARTLAEIEKCDLVCANCHRTRTWKNKKRKVPGR